LHNNQYRTTREKRAVEASHSFCPPETFDSAT
jgi:hypothetical protein